MQWHSGPGDKDKPEYFRGVCEAIAKVGKGAFMLGPGDLNPAFNTRWTIDKYLGTDYIWYPVVGNHDIDLESWIQWLRDYNPGGNSLPNIVNVGPENCEETMYSFDWGNCHFAVINNYCDGNSDTGYYGKGHGKGGTFGDALYEWLRDDLDATDKQHIFVSGHEPAYRQYDMDTGKERRKGHKGHNPDFTDRFWELLNQKGVLAYICGHNHSYKVTKLDEVWQIQGGHSQGIGRGLEEYRSTFIMIHINEDTVTFDTYRLDEGQLRYELAHSGTLATSKGKLKIRN